MIEKHGTGIGIFPLLANVLVWLFILVGLPFAVIIYIGWMVETARVIVE